MIKYIFLIGTAVAAINIINPGNANAGNDIDSLLSKSLSALGAKKGDVSLCAITNASYVLRNGQSTAIYIDSINDITGCSIGKNSLFLYRRPETGDIKIALFNKKNLKCTVIEIENGIAVMKGPVSVSFSRLSDDSAWNEIQDTFGKSDAFSILSIAYQWEAGAPYDFIKCAEIHNHLCAGITSGYLLAKFIMKNYPLGDGEKYVYISCPPWCKDDGIQTLLDLTPGKHGMFVTALSKEQMAHVADPDVAGILLIRKKESPKAKALIFSFDQAAANKANGSSNYKGIQASFKMLTGMIPYYDKPELFVHVVKELEISSDMADSLTYAGTNPYEALGFTK